MMSNAPHADAVPRKPRSAAAPATVCRYCEEWELLASDRFCGFCGRLTLALDVVPESLLLISTLAPQKELLLRNGSGRAMRVAIVQKSGTAFPAVAFEPSGVLEIAAGAEMRVRVMLNAKELAPGFQERALDFVCVVDDDLLKQRPLKIVVRSGPQPSAITPLLDFGNVESGKTVERNLDLKNAGGIPLRIRGVQAVGTSALTVAGDFAQQVVPPAGRVAIPITCRGDADAAAVDESTGAGIRIEFDNYPDALVVPAKARTYRYRIDAKPASVRHRPAVSKRLYTANVRLENGGTTDIEIVAVESAEPWIDIVTRATRFTLLSSAPPQSVPDPTTFAKSFEFKVVCNPKTLAVGVHRGSVIVRPHGQEPLTIAVEIEVVEPKVYPEYIGVDFGTTNSVVAVWSQQQHAIELVEDEASRTHLIPSVLVFDAAESYKIGQAARNEAPVAPDRTVRSIKRVMGYETDRKFFDRSYSAADIAALIIAKLVQLAEQKLSNGSNRMYDVRKAIITVPANFYDLQIRDVLEACGKAGLDTEEGRVQRAQKAIQAHIGETVNAGIILDEPSAAVLYYIDYLRRARNGSEIAQAIDRPKGLTLLVFDYGGGTLDVSVASVTRVKDGGTGLRILANMGDNTIGGDTIDLIVMKELLRRCKEKAGGFEFDTALVTADFKDLEARSDREGWNADVWRTVLGVRAQWKDLAEEAKIRIAEQKQANLDVAAHLIVRIDAGSVQIAPKSVRVEPLPRNTVDELLRPVLQRCDDLIRASLGLANVSAADVDYILHTGRQSLLPHIRKCVRGIFPHLTDDRDLLEEEHLKVCVAKGAALYGSMRNGLGDAASRIHFLSEGRRLPHSYGVETFTNPLDPELDVIIPRGSTYPVSTMKPYPPEMIPPSGYLNLKFYQNTGTSKAIRGNPHVSLIGQISIDTTEDGEAGCNVEFVVGANRTLQVFADGKPVTIERARLHEEESWMG